MNFEEHINHEQLSRLEHVAESALGSRLLPMNLETYVSPVISQVFLIAIKPDWKSASNSCGCWIEI